MNSYEIEELTRPKLLIPAGKCPVPLEDTSIRTVEAWIKKVREKIGPNFVCKPPVFRYWARGFYYGDPEKLLEVDDSITAVLNSSARLYDYMIGTER